MLTICNDPAGATGFQRFELDYSLTLQENIERHIYGGADYSLYINGEYVESPADCADLDRHATFADQVCVVRRPGAFGAEVWVPLLISLIAAVVAYAMMPNVSAQQPSIPNDAGSGKDSPNNQLTGQTNIARTYQAIPDIYGQVRAYPDLIQQTVEEYKENVKYLTETMCIGMGLYTVEQVKYADTPLEDVSGASYEVFTPVGYVVPGTMPEEAQTVVPNVWEPFRSPEVNGQEIVPPGDGDLVTISVPEITITRNGTQTVFRIQTSGPNTVFGQQLSSCNFLYFRGNVNYNDACTYEQDEFTSFDLPNTIVSVDQNFAVSSSSWSGSIITLNTNRTSGNWPAGNFECYFSATATSYNTLSTIQPKNAAASFVGPFIAPSFLTDQIWWNVEFLRGLKGEVGITAEWWKVDVNGNEIAGTKESSTYTYTGDTYDQKFFTEKVTPSAGVGRYRFQVKRTTPVIGEGTFDVAKLTALFAMRYYETKTFPGVTLVRVTTPATEQATGIRDRRFNALATRHCLWHNGEFGATRDFRRSIYHMFKVVAKKNANTLDIDSLIASGWQSIDAEEQNRFDFSFDDKDVSLGQRMQTAANCCRVQVFREGQKWMFARDRIRSLYNIALQFDYRNLAAGAEATRVFKGTLPSTKDGVRVEYTDPDTNKRTTYGLRISQGGVISVAEPDNPQVIQLAGCRTHSQAQKRAHYEARRMIYQRETVSDTALSDAALVNIGQMVRWVDPQDWYGDGGVWAGEVLAFEADPPGFTGYYLVTTSEPVPITAVNQCTITSPEGVPSSVAQVWPRPDGKNGFLMFSWTSAADNLFAASELIQCGSRYAVGQGVATLGDHKKSLYVLTSKKPTGDGRVSIELVNYDPRIYAEDGEIVL